MYKERFSYEIRWRTGALEIFFKYKFLFKTTRRRVNSYTIAITACTT